MATQSVTRNNNTPSWGPLLKQIPLRVDANDKPTTTLPADELKRIEGSAAEMIRVTIDGFSAIGELQWRAAYYDGGSIDADVFAMLAPLQTQLAELVATLRVTESNAAYYLRELESTNAKQEREP